MRAMKERVCRLAACAALTCVLGIVSAWAGQDPSASVNPPVEGYVYKRDGVFYISPTRDLKRGALRIEWRSVEEARNVCLDRPTLSCERVAILYDRRETGANGAVLRGAWVGLTEGQAEGLARHLKNAHSGP
jgi:hypothetical protein